MSFPISRGVNVSHWLSQSTRRGEERRAFFTRDDIRRIADGGMDHIRLPVDEEQLFAEDGRPDPEGFDLLDAGLDWCDAAGLRAVVDLHILRKHYFNQEDEPALFNDPAVGEHYVNLWRQISDRLRGRDVNKVAYELLNEPVARDPKAWNRVALAAFHTLRLREPTRTIVLGSNWYCTPHMFEHLAVPQDDRCILTFHFYDPMPISHYRASWWRVGGTYAGPVQYPGVPIAERDWAALSDAQRDCLATWQKPWDAAAFAQVLAWPLKRRAETGLPLYCGEFGCLETVPADIRRAWYRDVLAVFAEHGIAWANWDYLGRFGLLDNDRQRTAIADLFWT